MGVLSTVVRWEDEMSAEQLLRDDKLTESNELRLSGDKFIIGKAVGGEEDLDSESGVFNKRVKVSRI